MKMRATIYLAVCVAMTVAWLLVAWYPQTTRSQKLQTDQAAAETELTDFRTTMEQLPQFLAARRKLEETREQLQSSLFAKDDILKLLDHINKSADELGLEVVDINPPISELLKLNRSSFDPTDPNFLNLTYQVQGDFVPFGRFVQGLEKESFFRGVNACSIHGSRDHSTPTTYTLGFRALLGQVHDQSQEGRS